MKATRYNYTPEEKSALAELIGMVKNIQSQVFRLEPFLTRGIYLFIYKQLQDFMHCSLPEPLRKAEKRHKEILKGYLWSDAYCTYFTTITSKTGVIKCNCVVCK